MQDLDLFGANTSRRQMNGRLNRAGRTGLAVAVAMVLLLALVTGALAASVTPVHVSGASNDGKTCAELLPGSTELKVDPVPTGTYTRSDGTLSVTIVKPSSSAGSTNSFDWTANIYVAGVLVKDGVDGANWYDYSSLGGSKGDTYLTTPYGGAKGISHISFCYFEPEYDPLTASKTAAGTYNRDITWDLVKSVNPASHSGRAGETAGSSTWALSATKTVGAPYGFQVSGIITVRNSNHIPVSFSVADTLSDGTVASVNCPSNTVPAAVNGVEGSVTCTYTAAPSSSTADKNTAVITSLTKGVDGATATASLAWTENLAGYSSGELSDPRFGYVETISASSSKTFNEAFLCSANASDYTNGSYQYTVANWAYLNGGIGLSDSAQVVVTCYLEPLSVTKTAAGSYDRTVTWDLDKSVDDDSHSGLIGQPAGSSTWKVVATKSETLGNFQVAGTITINNPAAIAQTFSVSDTLNDGTVATVNCPSDTVAAGGTVVCTYTAQPADASATLNTVLVTATGNAAQTATAAVAFTENLIGSDSGTLSDPRFQYSETISASKTKTFPETFVCSADEADYTNGEYSYSVTNWAYLNGNIGLSDSATVKVVCRIDPAPAIDIEKATNGEDADAAIGPKIPVGGAVAWTYVVTNTGNVPLSGVVVTDDQGVTVSCPKNALAVDESMTCTAAGVAVAGQYANVGSVVGWYGQTQVSDSDSSHYFGTLGSLLVTKEVQWNRATPDPDKTFEICITGPSYAEAVCVLLKDGESHTWTDLIPGDYTVAESPIIGDTLDWTVEIVYDPIEATAATVVAEATAEVTVLNITDFEAPPTAVDLAQWDVTVGQSGVLHTWQTVAEKGVSGFRVYRGSSAAFAEAQLVGEVAAKGPSSYQWVESGVAAGAWHYWLVEVDGTGAEMERFGPKAVTVGIGGQRDETQKIYLPLTLL